MINKKNITLIIPYYKDSDDREFNLNFIIPYYKKHGFNNIVVCNMPENWRTKYINASLKSIQTLYFLVIDTDIILPQKVLKLIEQLYKYDFILTNKSNVLEVFQYQLINNYNIEHLIKKAPLLYYSCPGAFFAGNTIKYLSIGGENENFKYWGYEDLERQHRIRMLYDNILDCNNSVLHIHHQRAYSTDINNELVKKNQNEYDKVFKMNKKELINYINTWSWKI